MDRTVYWFPSFIRNVPDIDERECRLHDMVPMWFFPKRRTHLHDAEVSQKLESRFNR